MSAWYECEKFENTVNMKNYEERENDLSVALNVACKSFRVYFNSSKVFISRGVAKICSNENRWIER